MRVVRFFCEGVVKLGEGTAARLQSDYPKSLIRRAASTTTVMFMPICSAIGYHKVPEYWYNFPNIKPAQNDEKSPGTPWYQWPLANNKAVHTNK